LLNEHHLFNEIDPARLFKEWADRRVPEHAPFFVFGLYIVGAQIGGPMEMSGGQMKGPKSGAKETE